MTTLLSEAFSFAISNEKKSFCRPISFVGFAAVTTMGDQESQTRKHLLAL